LKHVAIVGGGATNAFAPWREPEWEIWGIPWISYPRATRFFQLHSKEFYDNYEADAERDNTIAENLKKFPDAPFYVHESLVEVFPKSIPYPLAEVLESIPVPYLENSIAFQLAFAIHHKVKTIALFGVHQIGEYVWEKPSVLYLVGLAQGRGIDVRVAPGSPLFISRYEAGMYGVNAKTRFIPDQL